MTHVQNTSPYPWPRNGDLDPATLALVVTGCDGRWSSLTHSNAGVIANINRLAGVVERTIAVHHRVDRLRSVGSASVPVIDHSSSVRADGVDAFFGSALESELGQRRTTSLLIAGFGLETTVHSTLRSANDRGFECLVVLDACSPVDPSLSAASRSMIEMSGGIFGAVGTTNDAVAALTGFNPEQEITS